jgi:regulator of sigma E protease
MVLQSLPSILIAILGLALLIVIHEGGHFLVARLCGMRVERFSVGFGKPLVSIKRGETTYQIAPIPLGGFVQITGLNPHEEFDQNDPYVYPNRPRWMRLAVLVAGPGANYFTAVLLAFGIFMAYGREVATTKVDSVFKESAAEAAGLKPGDIVVAANGAPVTASSAVRSAVRESKGQAVTVTVNRSGQQLTLKVVPRKDPSGDYLIGIGFGQVRVPMPTGEAIKDAIIYPALASGDMLKNMWEMIVGKQPRNLSGPVGIAREIADAARRGLYYFLYMMMALSIYLGLFNLLPLPALDGGRALFLGINALPIKQVSAKTETYVHTVGLLFLLGVFVLVTFKDIKELIVKFF